MTAKKILLVDDEEDILVPLVLRLKAAGYEVITAADGGQALEAARRHAPDLVLMDIKLPVMDGYEVCCRIRSDAGIARVPIIFLTADASIRVARETELCGASDYLVKPFRSEDLMQKITSLIGEAVGR